jgi:PKD repeat protein
MHSEKIVRPDYLFPICCISLFDPRIKALDEHALTHEGPAQYISYSFRYMLKNYKPGWLIALLISLPIALSAQQNEGRDYQLHLQSGVYSFSSTSFSEALSANTVELEEAGQSHVFRYVLFDRLPKAVQRQRMQAEGLELIGYLPDHVWLMGIPRNYSMSRLAQFGAVNLAKVDGTHKMSPLLAPGMVPDHAMSADGSVDVRAVFYPGHAQQMLDWFAANGHFVAADFSPSAMSVELTVSEDDARGWVLQNPYLQWLEPGPGEPVPDDKEARGLHRNNAIDTDYPSGRHYTGEGVGMAIADDGAVGPHIDFKGRLDQTDAGSFGGTHGDMTVGIACGAGNLNPRYRGMATKADMVVYNISGYPQIIDAVTNLTSRGVHVTSTSYSQGCNEYTSDTRFGDQQIRQNPTLIHVFSAGNSSSSSCGYGASGYGNITGGYKQGKNVIATGNLDDSDNRTSSSSRGPASDGRIKPDICANGTDQMSTDPNNQYSPGGGTSAAAPGIAGIIAQLIEAYRDLNGGADPETPLLKGALLNTAEDLGNPGPDFSHGWGRVNAYRAFNLLEENRYFDAQVDDGVTNTHSITVPSGLSELRVMVYWLDWEGTVGASKSLINDLNITLETPGGTIYNPWVLDETPSVAALSANATRGVDDLNNMEQVTLDLPAGGNYTLTVDGFTVPNGPQKYYVLYEFVGPEITVTYPIGGEGFVPGELEILRWDAPDDSGTFNVEYSADGGSTWNTINGSVSGSLRQVNWNIPSIVSGDVLVRVSRGAQSDVSDEEFSIIGLPSNIVFDESCPTSAVLSWDPVAGATAYTIYMLGDKYMDSITTVSGTTSATIFGTNPTDEFWFAVQARAATGNGGRRSNAVMKPVGVFSCTVAEDITLEDVLSPGGGVIFDCFDYSNVSVSLQAKNTGLNDAASYTLNASLDGAAPMTETRGPLASGLTDIFTFPSTLDLSAPGNYELKCWVGYGLDENAFNDTIVVNIEVLGGGSSTVGLFNQDLESFSNCGTATNCEVEICNLSDGWLNEANGVSDDIDWRTDVGGTASTGTGPSADHAPGTSSGKYLYLEASGGCEGQVAHLRSPCIDLSSTVNPVLTFWYHMYGGDMGELHVDLFDGTTWVNDIVSPVIGDQGNIWIEQSINLAAYAGQLINLRFRGITGNGFESDIALDDFTVFDLSSPPAADFTVDISSECPGGVIRFTDISTNAPSTWNWTVTPSAGVTFLEGTSSTSQNPVIGFSNLGEYTVSLEATNGIGSSTETKVDLISINAGETLPILEDLELFSLCSTSSDCGGTDCALFGGWTNAANGSIDDIDWRTDDGGTPSVATGPSTDANPGTTTGNYIYTEASGTCNGQEAHLISPCIDLTWTVAPVFTFDYHMFGTNMGELHVDIFADAIWTNDIMPSISGNQGDVWNEASIDLSPWNGKSVRLRVRGITGTGYESDIALDDFTIQDTSSTPCATPTSLTVSATATVATVSWGSSIGADFYNLQGRRADIATWRDLFVPAPFTSFVQGGLAPGTTYEVQVRARCADGSITAFSPIVSFTTASAKMGEASDLQVWPVPASDQLYGSFYHPADEEVELLIIDALGRVVMADMLQPTEQQFSFELDISHLAAGMYQMVLRSENLSEQSAFNIER